MCSWKHCISREKQQLWLIKNIASKGLIKSEIFGKKHAKGSTFPIKIEFYQDLTNTSSVFYNIIGKV